MRPYACFHNHDSRKGGIPAFISIRQIEAAWNFESRRMRFGALSAL